MLYLRETIPFCFSYRNRWLLLHDREKNVHEQKTRSIHGTQILRMKNCIKLMDALVFFYKFCVNRLLFHSFSSCQSVCRMCACLCAADDPLKIYGLSRKWYALPPHPNHTQQTTEPQQSTECRRSLLHAKRALIQAIVDSDSL